MASGTSPIASTQPAAQRVYWTPTTVPTLRRVNTLGVYVDGFTSAGDLEIGLYRSVYGAQGYMPGDLLGKGTVNITAGGALRSVTLTPEIPVLRAGLYWIGLLRLSGVYTVGNVPVTVRHGTRRYQGAVGTAHHMVSAWIADGYSTLPTRAPSVLAALAESSGEAYGRSGIGSSGAPVW